MRIKIKRTICTICAGICLLSMTACFFRPQSNNSGGNYSGGKQTTNNDLSYEAVAAELFTYYHVDDFTDSVPDRKEKKFVVVGEAYRGNRKTDTVREYQYEYDDAGRQTVKIDTDNAGSVKFEFTFNDDGTTAKKEFKKLEYNNGSNFGPDWLFEYEYNEDKQLISYSVSQDHQRPIVYTFTYENGHLVQTNLHGNNETYDYSLSGEIYDYCVVIDNSFSSSEDVEIVKRTYSDDTFSRVISEEEFLYNTITYYEYDGDTLTGWYHVDEWERTHKYDAKGNFIAELEKDGSYREKYEYNDKDEPTLHESYSDGKLVKKITYAYEYDVYGNMISQKRSFWSLDDDNNERTFVATTRYSYDVRGLLKSEVDDIDGSFTDMTVYAYKAILVPIDK